MKIVILAQYLRNIENFEGNNSRFVYLAKMLTKAGHHVEMITSDFGHGAKKHFSVIGELPGIKVTALHEPGYPSNICLKRFKSHKILANNLRNYLETRDVPDVIYAAIPSTEVAKTAAIYCEKNKVRFVIDVQDIWPEAFKLVFHVPVVSDLIFAPFNKDADFAYAAADEVVAVSETYVNRAMLVNKKCKKPLVVYLGTDFNIFDSYKEQNPVDKPQNELWIGYVGTLGASYDIKVISHAIKKLNEDPETDKYLKMAGYDTIRFMVMGRGPRAEEFKSDADACKINATFTGSLPYPQMVGRLCTCDLAVNPINHGAAQSIINKVGDYAAAGLAVINTLENEEYRNLIETYHCGYNCEANNVDSVAEGIKKWLLLDSQDKEIMKNNSRRLGEERFDRSRTYNTLMNVIIR